MFTLIFIKNKLIKMFTQYLEKIKNNRLIMYTNQNKIINPVTQKRDIKTIELIIIFFIIAAILIMKIL